MGRGGNNASYLPPLDLGHRPPKTPTGHRPPADWYSESRKHILLATGTRTLSDTMRYQSSTEMTKSVQRTEFGENKVDSALKAKITTTKELKELLEGAVHMTEKELFKMEGTKERLEEEFGSSKRHLQQNEERRLHRTSRPSREMVHDYPYKLFEAQGVFLQNSLAKLEDNINKVKDVLTRLNNTKVLLEADLSDKNAALDLDMKCIGLAPGENDPPIQSLQFSKLQPFNWSSNTKSSVLEAQLLQAESAQIRRSIARTVQTVKKGEKQQHDLVQQALDRNIASISRLRDDLHLQLQQVEEEINQAMKTRAELENAIAEKMPPLNLTKQRYLTRTQRPNRELVNDEVEHALKMQYDSLNRIVNELQRKLSQLNATLASLFAHKTELEENIADKERNYDMDKSCMQMAPSRPGTPDCHPDAFTHVFDHANEMPSGSLYLADGDPALSKTM
mmetsp:Transcript_2468/g.2733  ORF Transcript_2468/g.2733 Transcript_2468/m.2733 type:complete len:449 (+) Transcript_2468:313-1659(+)|eukprot:CAMPEP_0197852886 /NCGR_PEP_ID=MMETSP1438-20131217/21642_1 /TAXON_ID=1461541 /ORGANISM="Pterosperma sp., Strain CCMP1384" /LENGTH=448 /DNA_ID=CAMNT_0043467105 /DNA_START=307 /DNA_END=1653 /DNA_ORIENTATION=+